MPKGQGLIMRTNIQRVMEKCHFIQWMSDILPISR